MTECASVVKKMVPWILVLNLGAIKFLPLVNKRHLLRRTPHKLILIAYYVNATFFDTFSGLHQAMSILKLFKGGHKERN